MKLIIVFCIIFFLSFSLAKKDPTLNEIFSFIDVHYPTTPQLDIVSLGNCSFPISSSVQSALLQNYSSLGMCMLHTFWNSESLRAFREVIKIDNNNPMGYWGVYQSLVWDSGFNSAAEEAKQRALNLINYASDREKLYINSLKYNTSSTEWNNLFQTLFKEYPKDLNAKGVWSWAVVSDTIDAMGAPKPERANVQQFLKDQLKLYPKDVGLEHYKIHAYEDTLQPATALDSAKDLPIICPMGGHNVHMGGHIYFLIGDHDRAHDYFLQGKVVDEMVMKIYNVTFQEYWEYIHNIAYMVGNLAEGGRYTEAMEWGQHLASLKIDYSRPALLDWDPRYSRPAGRFFFQGLLALPLVLIQYEQWELAEYSLGLISKSSEFYVDNNISTWLPQYYEGLQKYTCVMKQFKYFIRGSPNYVLLHAQECAARLETIVNYLGPFMNQANENGFQVGLRLYISLKVNCNETQGALLAMTGNYAQANATFLKANISEFQIPYNEPPIYSRPVLMSNIDLLYYLQAKETNPTSKRGYLNERGKLFDSILTSPWHNNSGIYKFGKAQNYEYLNNTQAAKDTYTDFLKQWKSADQDSYMIQHARAYIAENRETHKALLIALIFVAFFVGLFFGGSGTLFVTRRMNKKGAEKYVALEKRELEKSI